MLKFILPAVAAALLLPAAASAAPAKKFLSDAAEGDRGEAMLGRLIAQHGQAGMVRDYGRTLSRDHGKAGRQVAALAHRMHISPSRATNPEALHEYGVLKHKRGAAFDRDVKRYMIEDHTKDIAEFRDQASHGDRQTAALARMTLPTLRHHLAIARRI